MQYNILWVDDRKDEFVELDYPNKLIKYVSEQFLKLLIIENFKYIKKQRIYTGSRVRND